MPPEVAALAEGIQIWRETWGAGFAVGPVGRQENTARRTGSRVRRKKAAARGAAWWRGRLLIGATTTTTSSTATNTTTATGGRRPRIWREGRGAAFLALREESVFAVDGSVLVVPWGQAHVWKK
jgi:hypothetical protein